MCMKENCVFVVFTYTFVEEINADRDYLNGCMLPKLELFYKKHYRKFLAENLLINVFETFDMCQAQEHL